MARVDARGTGNNSGATRYPWGIERYEEEIEHRTSDAENFRLKFDRKVFVDGELYAEKAWDEEVARDFQ